MTEAQDLSVERRKADLRTRAQWSEAGYRLRPHVRPAEVKGGPFYNRYQVTPKNAPDGPELRASREVNLSGKTFQEWSNSGYTVRKGEKMKGRNAQGKPLFTVGQVAQLKVKCPTCGRTL